MQKLAPKISVIGWCLWFVVALVNEILHFQAFHPKLSWPYIIQQWMGLGMGCACIALSGILQKRPQLMSALVLAGLSLMVLWKFYIGAVFFKMHPDLGGLTLQESIAYNWRQMTRTWFTFLTTVPFGIFVATSVVFWPFYGVCYYQAETSPPDPFRRT